MVRYLTASLLYRHNHHPQHENARRPTSPFLYYIIIHCLARSAAFFVDVLLDFYFVMDIMFNFRTAFYLPDGTREERPRRIAVRNAAGPAVCRTITQPIFELYLNPCHPNRIH